MATRTDHKILKGPTLRVHKVDGGYLPVLLYWGRGKPEWYRYHQALPTQEKAREVGQQERRRMRRQPHHYFNWKGDPWQQFSGDLSQHPFPLSTIIGKTRPRPRPGTD